MNKDQRATARVGSFISPHLLGVLAAFPIHGGRYWISPDFVDEFQLPLTGHSRLSATGPMQPFDDSDQRVCLRLYKTVLKPNLLQTRLDAGSVFATLMTCLRL